MSRQVQPVEDFTTTCLVMAFVNLMWILALVYFLWGMAAVLIVALALNTGINRLETHLRCRA